MAAVIVSASLVVAPALETTKTSTATSVVTSTSPQITVTNTVNFTSTIRSTITAMSSMPDSPCDTPIMGAGVPVLLMRPNSTGFICTTYRTEWLGNQTEFVRAQYRFNFPNPWHILPFPIGGLCSRGKGLTSFDQKIYP